MKLMLAILLLLTMNFIQQLYRKPLLFLFIFVPLTLSAIMKWASGRPLISWDDLPTMIFALFLMIVLAGQKDLEL